MTLRRLLPLLILLALPVAAYALEGKWTPQQVLELDAAWLKKEGLEITPAQLQTLLSATVNVGGCSGGFVSPDGLFVTNHHCLFGVLQEHSTPQNDIIEKGFLARTRDAELPSKTTRLTFPKRFVDVGAQVLAAVPKNATDTERLRAIERKMNDLVAECEKQPNTRCKVAAHDGGVQYILQEATELADVRLVYAPPRSVGEYGGEVDNWMWPRHTGDFAIGRAYVNGQPFRPAQWLPISSKGVKPGDFVMVLGYPGITYRSLTADEMTERHQFFTARNDVYSEWIRILEETSKGNAEGGIAVANTLKTLHNRRKNAEGQLAGFKRGSILDQQKQRDEAVLAWAQSREEHRPSVAARAALTAMAREQQQTFDHDFLLQQIQYTPASLGPLGPRALVLAANVTRAATERQKPDAERDATFMERNIARVRQQLEREQKNYFAAADKAMFASFVRRALQLPRSSRLETIDRAFEGKNVEQTIDTLYAGSKVLDLNERMKMFDETPQQLRARRDPLLELGFALDSELRQMKQRVEQWDATISRLRPVWRRAVIAHAGKPVAPDANSTLRVSFAHVMGYAPRDGVMYTPQTFLRGIVEKNTGAEPFNAPAAVLRGRPDLPINFLSDADTTGGNSGSPTLNGRGELVGLNFDRVWENVANDFGYNPDVNRNVNVDIRYMLWLLDEVQNADELLKELRVK
ncbi:MAG TPA: S46 family peptidase [Thermoanaerobaculia bacterium]